MFFHRLRKKSSKAYVPSLCLEHTGLFKCLINRKITVNTSLGPGCFLFSLPFSGCESLMVGLKAVISCQKCAQCPSKAESILRSQFLCKKNWCRTIWPQWSQFPGWIKEIPVIYYLLLLTWISIDVRSSLIMSVLCGWW